MKHLERPKPAHNPAAKRGWQYYVVFTAGILMVLSAIGNLMSGQLAGLVVTIGLAAWFLVLCSRISSKQPVSTAHLYAATAVSLLLFVMLAAAVISVATSDTAARV